MEGDKWERGPPIRVAIKQVVHEHQEARSTIVGAYPADAGMMGTETATGGCSAYWPARIPNPPHSSGRQSNGQRPGKASLFLGSFLQLKRYACQRQLEIPMATIRNAHGYKANNGVDRHYSHCKSVSAGGFCAPILAGFLLA